MWFGQQAAAGQGFRQNSWWQNSWRQNSWRQNSWRDGWQDRRQESWKDSWKESWRDFAARSRRVAADKAEFRRKIWRTLMREAANIPFVENALTAHYCAFDRQTPFYVKAALVGAVIYFIVPDDLIPDSIPVFGLADDAAVLAAAMKIFSSHIKPEHRKAARCTLERMRAEQPSYRAS